MTPGPALPPVVGGFYKLRAGLSVFVNGVRDIYGVPIFLGIFLAPANGVVTWHNNGQYSAVPFRPHELDIVAELNY